VTEWDQRELCPDGGCTGVIGPDGLCKTCGRAAQNWADDRRRGLKLDAETDPDTDPATATATASASATDTDTDPDSDRAYEWSRRKLCPDGACVGVLGSDNRCTTCGKQASP
jgi:hypothetical protein